MVPLGTPLPTKRIFGYVFCFCYAVFRHFISIKRNGISALIKELLINYSKNEKTKSFKKVYTQKIVQQAVDIEIYNL
ncbi:hypothetical protein HMPREF3293_01795 [Christensenella minuta]|uniref:Uncharacterized protein n=1 Tax=Christensenella minuta TaxID=626937 RepID=A0A136Q3V6_9FIRM|nr:hypothetical protein HMPREF3293_01795 [Christensenella minuta]